MQKQKYVSSLKNRLGLAYYLRMIVNIQLCAHKVVFWFRKRTKEVFAFVANRSKQQGNLEATKPSAW